MSWLCRLGFHRWGKWTIPYESNYIDTNRPYTAQQRICNTCGKFTWRIL